LTLNSHDISKLRRIISLAEKMIANGSSRVGSGRAGPVRKSKRIRRTGEELRQFRKMLKAQRKKGVPVAELSRKHGVSSAYIYMLP
jgi:hypothetical protein